MPGIGSERIGCFRVVHCRWPDDGSTPPAVFDVSISENEIRCRVQVPCGFGTLTSPVKDVTESGQLKPADGFRPD